MKNADIRILSLQELKEQIKSEKNNSQSLHFAHAISPLENPVRLKHNRRSVARLLTELNRRENEQANKTAK